MLEDKSERLEFQKMLSLPDRKNRCEQQQKKNMLKKKRGNKEKWIIKKEMNERTTKNDPSCNDPWSNHPKTQFGPIYLFFRNQEPWPTLRTWKVHFDWTWILGLKSFLPWEIFPNQQGCCLFSSAKILDKPFTCSGWIFKCIIGQSKKMKKKTWL